MTPLLNAGQRRVFLALCAAWIAAIVYFWSWWLQPSHIQSPGAFAFASLIIAWITIEPLYFLLIFARARKPAGPLNLPAGSRVAMVVTKAPGEPFSVVAETLQAMLKQDYPHDTWLADEDPSEETLAWCARNRVWVSTRRGREDYHRATWPRRTRCKEGNLAYFYDHYGYSHYDFVVQLDADHAPEQGYLREMLRPFADPAVGYVSAPSICDRNASQSWAARGRLYAEALIHGSLQAGNTGGWAPICIGSHYAVRTRALQQIGGLGPELAEDHSTSLMMNAHGWRGVHAIDAIAHGDGPQTFADMATQEFQWARSLVTILFQYSPKLFPALPGKLKFQFAYCQLWYPLYSVFMALMFAMPIYALLTGQNFAEVSYPAFFLHLAPISLVLMTLAYRLRAIGSCRPFNAKIISWESMLFRFYARWPWVLWGTITAIVDCVSGSRAEFRVTPKGTDSAGPLPLRVILPYAVLSAASALVTILPGDAGGASGFYIFALMNAAIYAILVVVIAVAHIRENRIAIRWRSMPAFAQAMLALALLLPVYSGVLVHGPFGVEALAAGNGHIALTRDSYAISGAGQNGERIVRFHFRWLNDDNDSAVPAQLGVLPVVSSAPANS